MAHMNTEAKKRCTIRSVHTHDSVHQQLNVRIVNCTAVNLPREVALPPQSANASVCVCVNLFDVSLLHSHIQTTVHVIYNPSWCRQNSFQSISIHFNPVLFIRSIAFVLVVPLLCIFIIYLLTCIHLIPHILFSKLSNQVEPK